MISLSRCMAVLYTIGALKNMLFILPVLMLYYGYKGVSMGDFYLIQGLSAMVVFLLEVPSGYIADIFSRKKTVILGMIVWVLGYLFWIFGDGFWFILMGELIFGVSLSLLSGALEAYIYDLLKKRKKEKSFHKKMAKYDMFTDLSLLFATLSGPFIYKEIGEDATVWFCVITMVVAIVLMCFMPDTPEAKREVEKNKSAFLDILEISIKTLKNYDIRNIIVFSGIYGTLTLVLMWGLQSVMMARDVPVYLFGVILAINAFGRAIWAMITGKMFDKLGLERIVKIMLVIIVVAMSSAILSTRVPYIWVYACLGGMIIGSGAIKPARIVSLTLVNHRTESSERATVLSVKNMIEKLFSGFGMIALKPLFDNLGVGQTYMICAILIIPLLWSASIVCKFDVYDEKK